jgi:hypothetical protein
VTIKTNADEGILTGALLYEKQMVDLSVDGRSLRVARSVLLGESATLTKDRVFAKTTMRGEARREAADFLRDLLRDGSVDVEELEREADAAGLAWRTVQRASKDIGVVKRPQGFQEPWGGCCPGQNRPLGKMAISAILVADSARARHEWSR